MSQKANTNNGGQSLQVAGDLRIGLSYSETKDLFDLLLNENFPKLVELASAEASENVKKLHDLTHQEIQADLNQMKSEKLASTDVQYMINQAVVGAARKGSKTDLNVLAKLISERIKEREDDFLDNCLEEAATVIPKLTNAQVCFLAFYNFTFELSYNNISEIEKLYNVINIKYLDQIQGITQNQLKTMGGLGILNYTNVYQDGKNPGLERILIRYKLDHLSSDELKTKYPSLLLAADMYKEKSLSNIFLTTIGGDYCGSEIERSYA